MSAEQILGVIASLAAALIVGVLSLMGVRYGLRAQERSEARSREEEAERLLRRYRDPLVRSAFDLQSRLYNIVTHDFLGTYYMRGTELERRYAFENTLYVVGEYLGWVEIMRREVQFLDLRDVDKNRELSERLDTVSQLFLAQDPDPTLRIFRGEQRAIGDVMMSSLPSGARECIGFAAFIERRADPAFSSWFEKLGADVELLASEPGRHQKRAVAIQRVLIDLLDFLDPVHQYFPAGRRQKLAASEVPTSDTAE